MNTNIDPNMDLSPEQLKEMLDDAEFSLKIVEACFDVAGRKKYKFMLSNSTIAIILVAGFILVIFSILFAADSIKKGLIKPAIIGFIIAMAIEIFFVIWSLKSKKLQKELEEEAEKEARSGRFDPVKAYSVKDSELIVTRFKIEDFENLSKLNMLLAKEEWDSNTFIITQNYYRMLSIQFPDKKNNLYDIFIEIRYEDGIPERENIDKLEDQISDFFEALQINDLSKEKESIKNEAKDLVRASFTRLFPYIRIKEICIAVTDMV
ncbi:MAG: hypothetical protein K6E10_07500 [Eubacterium sp.]|nr:hypothetical protein [Eubacterium sp.]